MTKLQQRIIKAYEEMTEIKTVHPSYRVLAKKVNCNVGMAFKTIKAYRKQKEIFKI